jgi:hypothetical protein
MLEQQASGGRGYDWTVVLLSFWFVGGLFLDGWAHNHIPELESFLRPGMRFIRVPRRGRFPQRHAGAQSRQGYPWQHAMPPAMGSRSWVC